MNLKVSLLFLYLLFPRFLNAQESIKPYKIRENLYAITELDGGNVSFLVTRKGILVVDAGSTPGNGEKIVSIIREVSDEPIKYLILTHFHGDHINGIAAFPEDVKIIAHEKLIENNKLFNEDQLKNYINKVYPKHMESLKVQLELLDNKETDEYIALKKEFDTNKVYYEDIKKIKIRKPDKTFNDYYKIKLADERIILEYPDPGHTSDNIVVKFSNHNVIHTGDLVFNACFPYLIVEHGVDVYNWIQILDDLYLENISRVIPGHGDVAGKRILKEQADYFRSLAYKIDALRNAGYELDEIKKRIDIKEFDLKGNEGQFSINIEVIYSELENTLNEEGQKWWKF